MGFWAEGCCKPDVVPMGICCKGQPHGRSCRQVVAIFADLMFSMPWTDGAKKMLGSFWQPAVGVTEQYARDNNNDDKDPGGIMIEHAVGKERAELSLKALF